MLRESFVRSVGRTILTLGSFFALAGCLPSEEPGGQSGEGASFEDTVSIGNTAPLISGLPRSRAVVDQLYTFQPQAYDPDGDVLTFSVAGLPNWASFDPATGILSGMPSGADVATFGGVVISVSDGQSSEALAPFSITVDAYAMGTATLSWQPPSQNTDGSMLNDLSGYRIYWGSESGEYTDSLTIDNPGVTTYVVDNLVAGNYYFVSTALNAAGVESNFSNEAYRAIQ